MKPAHWVILVGLLFWLLSLVAAFADAAKFEQMQKQMLSHTAQLNENCSATLVHSSRDDVTGEVSTVFLTAKHCVEGKKSDMVLDLPVYQANRLVKKERYIARVKGEWYAGDLAILELKDKQTFFASVAKIAPEKPVLYMGEDVWTVGYPLGRSLTISQGMFGALETEDFLKPGMEYFRATPDIAGGNSGGAMYHMGKDGYEIIGVTTARARSDGWIGLYTPIGAIHEYLKRALPEAVKAE